MVDDNVLGLDIPVHDSVAVSIVQPLEHLVNVELAVPWGQYLQQLSILRGSNVFHHQAEDFAFLDNV